MLREQEELDSIRPELDGNEIMRILGLKQGPVVGKAYSFMMELRLSEGMVGPERATQELLRWAAAEGLGSVSDDTGSAADPSAGDPPADSQ